MKMPVSPIVIGNTPLKRSEKQVHGENLTLSGEVYYRISNFDAMEPFFMSLVSSSDHWLFIASTGGLSAGRVSPERSLFPYYTVDKLTENSDNTGNKAILLVNRGGRISLWEPLSDRQQGIYAVARSLYKNVSGTTLVFEEANPDLGLTYRYAWRTSERFGFVKTTWLVNTGDSPCEVELLDGIQNILPANVAMATQQVYSVLLDAYKRSELNRETGLAIFALNSTLTDLAEPSESLLATTVAQVGLAQPGHLLSSTQLDRFRMGMAIEAETEVRGRRGAYFVHTTLALTPHEEQSWHLLADVQQDSASIAERHQWLHGDRAALVRELEGDIATTQFNLWKIVAGADGIQLSNSQSYPAYHFASVMFNVMRGGTFADHYWIETKAFADLVAACNLPVLVAHADFFAGLPPRMLFTDLQSRLQAHGSADLIRLGRAYLPLTFSRRHGDPSRPWNRFAISLKKPDGSMKLDYEGNWRDIFQNWEALAYSYPEFIENMISTFLNATTADGYNPYRITYHGVDWETPEPGNPWANIGYWSDHQIIYLQKLLEISVKVHPGRLQGLLSQPLFSYANVPYRLKPYVELLKDPYNTIDFDWDLEKSIRARRHERGTDGKLVCSQDGQVLHVSLAEKLLTLLLAKLANFVPEGGIWMNTQRPEWNDANNALVGKGLSVVTLCYLRRYLAFCQELLSSSGVDTVPLHAEVHRFYRQVAGILEQSRPALGGSFDDEARRCMMDLLGQAGSDYRWNFYRNGFSTESVDLPVEDLAAFFALAQQYIEQSLRANKRSDNLYHAYNVLHLADGRASVSWLYEMLEGQVAILSSGLLSGEESLALLQSLRESTLYEADQQSYILYPDRQLPGFLERNSLTRDQVLAVGLLAALVATGDPSIITRDVYDVYHFNGSFRNFRDVSGALEKLKAQPRYAALVEADFSQIQALFDATFHHDQFTGRSGTFFAYEGLGSIYWHMVAKLLLAVQETILRLKDDPCAEALIARYADIRQGLSFNKSPQEYGAYPTDPYSHTPKGQGAKQPGTTGMVKEVILTRQAELGLAIEDGRLVFDALLLDPRELLSAPAAFSYLDVHGRQQTLELKTGSLAYTVCQTPVIIETGPQAAITVHLADGTLQRVDCLRLDASNSRHIFQRDGVVHHLTVCLVARERTSMGRSS